MDGISVKKLAGNMGLSSGSLIDKLQELGADVQTESYGRK